MDALFQSPWHTSLLPAPSSSHRPQPQTQCRDTTEELSALFYDLKKGKYDAVVLDAPVVDYFSGIDEDCKLTTRGGPIYIFDLAVAFPVGFNYDDKFVFDT